MLDLARVVDAVMALTAVECLLLWCWHRFTGRGLQPSDYALSLLSGVLLMGALRCVLTPSAEGLSLLCLAGSGVCHALDLRQRWRRARDTSAVPKGARVEPSAGPGKALLKTPVKAPVKAPDKGAAAQAG